MTNKTMKKRLVTAIMLGLLAAGTGSMQSTALASTSAEDAAAEGAARTIPSAEETLAKFHQERLAREAEDTPVESAQTKAPSRTERLRAVASEVDDLRSDIQSVNLTQTQILNILDRLENRLHELEQEQEREYKAIPAPSSYSLVNPAPGNERVSYTQDAINSQGNSTMVFTYAPEQLYKIYCRRGYLTDLAFKKGEAIQFVGGGDTAGWSVSTTTVDGTAHLYIKPIVETSTTNLIVTTTKRSYQLILNTSNWYNPMVYWTYGAEDHADALLQKQQDNALRTGSVGVTSVEDLDFNYKVSGKNKEYKPEAVFSDGQRVYLKYATLPKQQVPIFIQEQGRKGMTLVNYRQKDNYYIIEATFEKAQLRVSERETVTIEKKR